MNIFYLSDNPAVCAEFHCDKHCIKMILETAQLLSTAHHVLDNDKALGLNIYRKTHANHPSAVWVRSGNQNYQWTWQLLKALCEQYTRRYGKVHATMEKGIVAALERLPEGIPYAPFTVPPQCMPDDYKNPVDTVMAYRTYYNNAKAYMCNWTNIQVPFWFRPVDVSV